MWKNSWSIKFGIVPSAVSKVKLITRGKISATHVNNLLSLIYKQLLYKPIRKNKQKNGLRAWLGSLQKI